MNYYSILGIDRNASQDDIKKAYRKLAMKHHPDKGGDESKFKEIEEAYRILGNPQARAEYDNPQPRFNSDMFRQSGFGGFEDIFGQAFGFGGPIRRQQRNKDVSIRYTVDFKDVFTGKEVNLAYTLPNGEEDYLNIRIPAGVKNGDVINFAGYGDNSIKQFPRGNLILKLRVLDDPVWRRDGDNIYTNYKINIFDLLLGTTIRITTPLSKELSLTIPKGTRPGITFSIAGNGVPNINTGKPGNIYVKIDTDIPEINDEKLLEKIKEIKNELDNGA